MVRFRGLLLEKSKGCADGLLLGCEKKGRLLGFWSEQLEP